MEKSLKQIVNKFAYIGRHTLEAREHNGSLVVTVFTNCPKKYETTFSVSNKKELINLSNDHQYGIFRYVGSLSSKLRFSKTVKTDKGTKTVDNIVDSFEHFISCFKYPLNNLHN